MYGVCTRTVVPITVLQVATAYNINMQTKRHFQAIFLNVSVVMTLILGPLFLSVIAKVADIHSFMIMMVADMYRTFYNAFLSVITKI